MPKKELLTHYEFQKFLALGLIDPDGWGAHSENWRQILSQKGRGTAYENEYHQIQKQTVIAKATRINDSSLDPIIGKLRNRLTYGGPDNLRHLPVKCTHLQEPLCALHRYSFGREDNRGKYRAQCMWCHDCQLVLCLTCFEHFHTIKNPKQLKQEVIRSAKKQGKK